MSRSVLSIFDSHRPAQPVPVLRAASRLGVLLRNKARDKLDPLLRGDWLAFEFDRGGHRDLSFHLCLSCLDIGVIRRLLLHIQAPSEFRYHGSAVSRTLRFTTSVR